MVVDLGCGDAALAQNLVPKGYNVLSYDLISANPFIVATDICGKLPVPGSEVEDEGQIVDVVVCSLSLMSTNWLNCIREARRILKKGYVRNIKLRSDFSELYTVTLLEENSKLRKLPVDSRALTSLRPWYVL